MTKRPVLRVVRAGEPVEGTFSEAMRAGTAQRQVRRAATKAQRAAEAKAAPKPVPKVKPRPPILMVASRVCQRCQQPRPLAHFVSARARICDQCRRRSERKAAKRNALRTKVFSGGLPSLGKR